MLPSKPQTPYRACSKTKNRINIARNLPLSDVLWTGETTFWHAKHAVPSLPTHPRFPPRSKYGEYYPWATYYWGEDKLDRHPRGQFCAPCRNTYRSGGYRYLFGMSLQAYGDAFQLKNTPQAKGHDGFLETRNKTIQHMCLMHQGGLTGNRITKDRLDDSRDEAHTTVLTANEESGFRDKGPARQFIEKDFWDPDRHGPKPTEPAT